MRAKETIDRLIKKRLVAKVEGSKPRYKLTTWAQFVADPKPLTESQAETLEIIRQGGALSDWQRKTAGDLLKKRRVCFADGAYKIFELAPELAFLPKAFVTSAKNETAPNEAFETGMMWACSA